MRVIVAGAGKLGRRIADIIKEKHTVIVIEQDEARSKYIEDLLGVRVVTGDANDPNRLTDAGVDQADVMVACTGDDEDNLVICMLSKFEFKVPKVIGAVRNPKNQWLYNRSWGVDVAIDSAQIVAQLIEEEASLRDIVTLLKLREGEVTVTELTVSATSNIAGKLANSIELPEHCIIAAILRGTDILVPSANVTIETGDELLFIAHTDAAERLPELVE